MQLQYRGSTGGCIYVHGYITLLRYLCRASINMAFLKRWIIWLSKYAGVQRVSMLSDCRCFYVS